jgi:hypothetical protein
VPSVPQRRLLNGDHQTLATSLTTSNEGCRQWYNKTESVRTKGTWYHLVNVNHRTLATSLTTDNEGSRKWRIEKESVRTERMPCFLRFDSEDDMPLTLSLHILLSFQKIKRIKAKTSAVPLLSTRGCAQQRLCPYTFHFSINSILSGHQAHGTYRLTEANKSALCLHIRL